MYAIQLDGPETASNDTLNDESVRPSQVETKASVGDLLAELNALHADLLASNSRREKIHEYADALRRARERALRITQTLSFDESRRAILLHATISVVSRLIWRINRKQSFQSNARIEAKCAIALAKNLLLQMRKDGMGVSVKLKHASLLREDLLQVVILGCGAIRMVFPCIDYRECEELRTFCRTQIRQLATGNEKDRPDGKAYLYFELAQIYAAEPLPDLIESKKAAKAGIQQAIYEYDRLIKDGQIEEARTWNDIIHLMASTFDLKITL